MNEGLKAFKKIVKTMSANHFENQVDELSTIEKELKALNIIISIFDIKIVGDYLIARRGETCIVYNLKLKQSQEIINLLKEVLKK